MTGSPNVRSKGNVAFSDWRGLCSVMRGWARTRSCPYSMKDTERGGSLNSLASADRARVEIAFTCDRWFTRQNSRRGRQPDFF